MVLAVRHPPGGTLRFAQTSFWPPRHGEYKCVITGGGKVLKELHFTVDAKGNIAKSPCQAQSMNSPRSITLLTTKLKTPYNAKWDKKLAAKRAYGGGVTWAKGCPPTK